MYVKPNWSKPLLGRVLIGAFFFLTILFFQNFTTESPSFSPRINSSGIDQDLNTAEIIYRRITGVRIPIDDPRLRTMAEFVRQGDRQTAATIALEDANFYNITLKEMASYMATREVAPNARLNDFIASFIGMVRDDVDAKKLLTANYFYSADPSKAPAELPNDLTEDILTSNDHYMFLDRNQIDLKEVLQRQPTQFMLAGVSGPTQHVDAAGLITSRAFMEQHAVAGTNRRLVEYVFKSFMCVEINEWADTSISDIRVGRDVDRFPEGSNSVFQQTCKGCHAGMDSLRPAFAYYDFSNSYVKYAQLLPSGRGAMELRKDDFGLPEKFSRASDVFPEGYTVRDNQWQNISTTQKHDRLFGWRGDLDGRGVGDLGRMISESQGFSKCMIKRVFKAACRRDLRPTENALHRMLTNSFEQHYSIKRSFAEVVSRPECIGQ